MVRINFFQNPRHEPKACGNPKHIYSKEVAESQNSEFVAFPLALFPFPPSPFQRRCSPENQQDKRRHRSPWRGQNGVGAPSKPHSQRIVIIRLVCWFPGSPHLQGRLYFAWSELARCEKPFPQGHSCKKRKFWGSRGCLKQWITTGVNNRLREN